MTLYFDDFPVGFTYETATRTVTLDDILDFANDWDPQPFHTDAEAAKDTIYGGIISSGWQTLAIAFRLWYDTGIWTEASMGSPGLDGVRWKKPVRPGDTLRVRAEVLESTPSASRADRGRLLICYHVMNQKDEEVAEVRTIHLMKRKQAADDATQSAA